MKILLSLSVGFLMLTSCYLFFVVNVNAVFAQFNNNNPFLEDPREEFAGKLDRVTTRMADILIEGEFSDEQIDEELSSLSSEISREIVVKKLKEKGSDYNGQYISLYNEYLQEQKEKEAKKEEAKKTDPYYINKQKQDTKMKELVNKLNLNASEIHALENFVSLNDLLKIQTREDLDQRFLDESIDFNDPNHIYDDYVDIENYKHYFE